MAEEVVITVEAYAVVITGSGRGSGTAELDEVASSVSIAWSGATKVVKTGDSEPQACVHSLAT